VDDDTIPNATTDALARALDVTQVCPCPYSTLGLETVAAPYTGNGLVYYPDAAHGFLLANSSNPAASDQARRQAAHFLRTALRNGAGEIVVPGE